MKIYPSLISAPLLSLEKMLFLLDPHCDGYHLDVMDDHFVPNLTWGPSFINAIADATQRPLQIHLMVDVPARWIERLELRNGDSFVFHYEALQNIAQAQHLIEKITARGWKAGIAINPPTPVTALHALLPHLHEVLIMSVNPGFSGQKFIPEIVAKVKPLMLTRQHNGNNFTLCMDGGIGQENITMLKQEGVELFAMANAIFASNDPVGALQSLYKN